MAKCTREEIEEEIKISRKLEGTDLRDADLPGASLSEANLSRADLIGAKLRGADLRGVDLRGVDLREANLRGAMYNNDTKFPEDFVPETAEMVLVELPLAVGV